MKVLIKRGITLCGHLDAIIELLKKSSIIKRLIFTQLKYWRKKDEMKNWKAHCKLWQIKKASPCRFLYENSVI